MDHNANQNTNTSGNAYGNKGSNPEASVDVYANDDPNIYANINNELLPLPPFHYGGEPSTQINVEPLAFVHDDLLDFACHTHATPTPLTWMHPSPDNDSFVAMMLDPPELVSEIKYKPPHSPLRIHAPSNANFNTLTEPVRRSSRLTVPPRRFTAEQPTALPTTPATFVGTPSTVGVTSDDDDDGDGEDDGDHNDDGSQVVDKKERRRQQVRKASSRRRAKLKAEGEFLTNRQQELDEHMAVLHLRFPQLVPPPTLISQSSNKVGSKDGSKDGITIMSDHSLKDTVEHQH